MENKRIVVDIDGVTRSLHEPLEEIYNISIDKWDYVHNGKDFWTMIKENPNIWVDAPPTEYYGIIKKIKDLEFWTIQRPEYQEFTRIWLDKYFKKYKLRFFKDFNDKFDNVIKENVILIDDFPDFPDYTNILLINRRYNQKTNAHIRVKTPEQLKILIQLINIKGV